METLKRYKGTIAGLMLLVGLYFVYVQFIQGENYDPLLRSIQTTGVDGAAAGQQIIFILNDIKSIKFDTSIFENEAFKELVDYRTDIIPESVGRENPFDPIGIGIDISGNTAKPNEDDIQVIDPQ